MSRSKMLTDGDVRREIAARDDGSTHWDGCWESHHDCAIVMLADARAELAKCEAERKRLVALGAALAQWALDRDDGGLLTILLNFDVSPVDDARAGGWLLSADRINQYTGQSCATYLLDAARALLDCRAEVARLKAGHAQLAAHVERLREALQEADDAAGEWVESSEELQWPVSVRKALASTPAQSLAEHDAEIVERCAAIVLDEVDGAEEERARDSMLSRIAAAIRALKPASEVKPCR